MSKKRSKKNSIGRIILIVVLSILLIVCAAVVYVVLNLGKLNENAADRYFEIQPGQSATQVIANLEAKGFIRDEFSAMLYFRAVNPELKSGAFYINSAMSTNDILDYLSDASNIESNEVSITFIEGDWLKDMATKISSKTNVTSDELLAYWNNEEEIRKLMEKYPFITEDAFHSDVRYILEGYLHPNTYNFFVETTPKQVTEKMLDGTLALYKEFESQILASEFSVHEIFTLASIVQAEAGKPGDMGLVAGVLLNRINQDMLLQVSVSICYAVDMTDADDWTVCETNPDVNSPYNTYIYPGLTPGPIKSFGRDALNAVLNPIESDYLYFVADVNGTGDVYYSSTYEQHLDYVEKFGLNF